MGKAPEIVQVSEVVWEITQQGQMRVPGRIFASRDLIADIAGDPSLQQVANVACLPGIVGASLAMPDIHWGYGFPIGGVAAMDAAEGVISPGGVGYDINCGVRLAVTALSRDDISGRINQLADALFASIPCGVGAAGAIKTLSVKDERRLVTQGSGWAVSAGFGEPEDLAHTEEEGCLAGADSSALSETALERGRPQLGTLGSGNHFLEVDVIDEIFDPGVANRLGLFPDQVVILVHSGSRGLGYQVCDDFLRVMGQAMLRYSINLPDRQLACAPIRSPEGEQYLAAMACAANYAWANRQVMMALASRAFQRTLDLSPRDLRMRLVYDVCHNIAKFEEHEVGGQLRRLCVHRKGATRAFGRGHKALGVYRDLGQPVLIPGDMGRYSFLLVGREESMRHTFGSTCHGADRVMTRKQAKKRARSIDLGAELESRGVTVRSRGHSTVAEEMPYAYKDVAQVVDVMEQAGVSSKVARFKPLAVIKG